MRDLHGVGPKINARLNKLGIYTPNEFRNAVLDKLKVEFKSFGYYWNVRLNGYEIDNYISTRKSVGHSYHIPYYPSDTKNSKSNIATEEDIEYLKGVLLKLTEKACSRLRRYGLKARCFSVYCFYKDYKHWHMSHRIKDYINSTDLIFKEILKLFEQRNKKNMKMKVIAISTSNFVQNNFSLQKDLFGTKTEKENFYKAIDAINNEFGDFTIMPATLLNHKNSVPDRIAFGNTETRFNEG